MTEPPDWVKRIRSSRRDSVDAGIDNINREVEALMREAEPEAFKPPPLTMADIPRWARRIFIICAFLPVMGWTVCERWWQATRSMCVMIRCDWQEEWNAIRKDWNL